MSGNKRVSRRSFLQTSAGLAASAAAVNQAFRAMAGEAEGETKVDDRPFKLGLIGCGSQSVFNLMPAALRIPGTTFTAVCDVVPARAKQAQDATKGKAKIYDDYRVLLKEADMDAVMIVTPLFQHKPMVLEAFKNGRHVFCEKAMAYSIDDCKEMLRAQMKAGKLLQIGHHLRYHPLYYFAKQHYIDAGLLGRVNNIHCQWNRNGDWRRVPPKGTYDFKKWGYEHPDHLWNWRLYEKYSFGLMTELCSHQLDIINWFLGDKLPEAVQGVGRTYWKEEKRPPEERRTIFDNVHLIYEYPDEVQMTCESITNNEFCPYGLQAYEIFQGELGTLVMAHLSHFVGMFFLEPGKPEQLWMPLAHRIDFLAKDFANILPRFERYKRPIVLNGTPSPGSKIENVGDVIPLADLVNVEKAVATKSTYEIELICFKKSVLDNVKPFCDGFVGLKSAAPALIGYEAMKKQQRIVIDPNALLKL